MRDESVRVFSRPFCELVLRNGFASLDCGIVFGMSLAFFYLCGVYAIGSRFWLWGLALQNGFVKSLQCTDGCA